MRTLRILAIINVMYSTIMILGTTASAEPPGWFCRCDGTSYVCDISNPAGGPNCTNQECYCADICQSRGGVQNFICGTPSGVCVCNGGCSPPPLSCEDECAGNLECICTSCLHGSVYYYEGGWDCVTSPILINLANNGYGRLTSPADGVWFDLTARGSAVRTAWTTADSAMGFLVWDRNNNGTIDDGSELFGNATRRQDGSIAANGFDALRGDVPPAVEIQRRLG
jgi:hypothetical protein